MADDEMAAVRKADLDTLVAACTSYLPADAAPEVLDAFERMLKVFDETHGVEGEMRPAEPDPGPLPDGIFGRCELPGYRQHTGWITEETVFGLQMAVIRDWDGRVVAEVALGPGSQIVHLPTPLKRPGPVAAITAGDEDDEDDQYADAF